MNENKEKVGQPLLPTKVKKIVGKVHMRLVCTYEGCGADDGCPA